MPKPKINLKQLDQMLRAGESQRKIAQVFGVTESAVSKAKKQLRQNVVKVVGLEKANEVVEVHLDVVGQLRSINLAIYEELNRAKEAVTRASGRDQIHIQNVITRLSAEIRRQLETQMKICQLWYEARAVAEFQSIVVTAINEISPELKEKIICRLQERRGVRSAVEFK
jgi:predicted transcriptional regulator